MSGFGILCANAPYRASLFFYIIDSHVLLLESQLQLVIVFQDNEAKNVQNFLFLEKLLLILDVYLSAVEKLIFKYNVNAKLFANRSFSGRNNNLQVF